MIAIPDANVIISALIKRGKALELFELNDFTKEIKFVAPESLSIETREKLSLIAEKSRLLESEIILLLNKIESQIEFMPSSKFEDFIEQAIKISPPNDFPYTALALFLLSEGKEPIVLSNDKELLKSLSKTKIKGFSIHDFLSEFKIL